MNEIEEDEDCEHEHEIEDADESVDMYTKSAYASNESSDCFVGAINWQQEAIEQKIHDESDLNDHSSESHDLDSNQNSDYNLAEHQDQDSSQGPFNARNMEEEESSQSLGN